MNRPLAVRTPDLPWLAFGGVMGLLLARFAFGWGWIAAAGAVLGVGGAALALMLQDRLRREPPADPRSPRVTLPASRRLGRTHLPWLGFGALFGGLLFTAGFGPGWVTIIGVVCGLGGIALVLAARAYRPNQPTTTPGAPMPMPPGGE